MKKRKLKWYPHKFLINLWVLISTLFLIWFIISYFQIVIHNGDYITYGVAYEYPEWNIIITLINWFK